MKWYQRAMAYLSRKRIRVALLFFILSLITTAMIAVLALQSSINQVEGKLLSLSNAGFQIQSAQAEGMIKASQLAAVSKVDGIAESHYQVDCLARLEEGEVVEIKQAVQRDQEDDQVKNLISVQGIDDSQADLDFASGVLTLIEGRALTPQDRQKVLIHEQLAQANGLKVGDRVKIQGAQLGNDSGTQGQSIEAEIIGIYSGKRNETFSGLSSDLTENRLYLDYTSSQSLLNRASDDVQVSRAQYRVSDPKSLDTLITRVKSLDLDWSSLQLTQNSQAFEQVAGPIHSFKSLMQVMTGAVLLVGIVTLFLVLLFCMRERIHEFGILLSLGIQKREIISQLLLELWSLSLGAWAVAALLALPLAGGLFSGLVSGDDIPETVGQLFQSASPQWQGSIILIGYGSLLLIIVLAVAMSAGLVLFKKPRDILGQLS